MSTTFKIALFFFLLLILAGLMFGLARDLYSIERGVVRGTVIEVNPSISMHKPSSLSTPNIKVRLADGAVAVAAAKQTVGLTAGAEIDVTEMIMPWG
jgi:hypothetical protein